MPESQFKKIVIFGVGLIGGSFALALRKANAVGEVVGFGPPCAARQRCNKPCSSAFSIASGMMWLRNCMVDRNLSKGDERG